MDKLEGFRGARPANLQRALLSAEETGRIEDVAQTMLLGMAAEKFILGLASPEECKRIAVEIIVHCEETMREHLVALVECTDLNSAEAKEAHYKARVAGAILATINGIITRGRAAAHNIETEQSQ